MDARTDKRDVTETMHEELRRLEEEITLKTERLRVLIDKIES